MANLTGKQRMEAIFDGGADRSAFWHGNPHPESIPIYYEHFDVADDLELSLALGDDFVWVMGDWAWMHPEGEPMFDLLGGKERTSLNQDGAFAEATSVAEVEAFHWPDPKHLDFTYVIEQVERARSHDLYVLSGMWSPFFHLAADFFGMANYFVKMYTHPEVVQAVTEHIVNFYLEANELYFNQVGDKIDAFFFGNDFGTQQNLFMNPEQFEKFVLPYFVKFTEHAKSHDYKVVLHSCGAIEKAIPYLLDAGVDALHPLQALAKDMDADNLASKYKGDVVFIGGVDTQQLLPFGTPEEVYDEVIRLKKTFGPQYVVSPSHEALLPNVSVENLLAMVEAAKEEI